VQSGYMTCAEAGTAHASGHRATAVGAGPSMATGDNQAIWEAWKEAKERGCIPQNDPIPSRALRYIAGKHGLETGDDDLLPRETYRKALQIVEARY